MLNNNTKNNNTMNNNHNDDNNIHVIITIITKWKMQKIVDKTKRNNIT